MPATRRTSRPSAAVRRCSCGYTHRPDVEHFYVSVVDGPRYQILLGPFHTHQQALAQVDPAKAKANELDPKAWFYAFGTCGMPGDFSKPGILNQYFPDLFLKEK